MCLAASGRVPTDAQVLDFVAGIWRARSDRYSDQRAEKPEAVSGREKIEMSYIGG